MSVGKLNPYYYIANPQMLLGLARPSGSADTPAGRSRERLLRRSYKLEGTLRESLIVLAIVVAAHLLLRGAALFLVGAFNDDGAYVMLAKSIADGDGYRLPYLIGAPVAVKYPPALPALLAVPWALGGTLDAVRATVAFLNPVVCGLAAAIIWWIGRRNLALAAAPLAVAAIGPLLLDAAIQYFNIPLSEPYFLVGWATAVALTATARRPREAIVLGLVLAVTALFRSAGLALIPACLVALALRRVPKRVLGSAAVAAILPVLVWSVVHQRIAAAGPLSSSPDEVPYWSLIPFGSGLPRYLLDTGWNNARVYFTELSAAMAGPVAIGHFLVSVLLVAAVAGAVHAWRRDPAVVLTVAASLAVVLVWPFAQDRFLLPVLPFLGLLAAVGIGEAARRLPARLRLLVPIMLALATLVVGLRQADLRREAATSFVGGQPPKPRDASIFFVLAVNSRHIAAISEWIRGSTTPRDRILVDFPAATHLYSGRTTAPASPAEAASARSVFEQPGHYLASRIIRDSVNVIAIGIRGRLSRDIDAVARACPGVLQKQFPAAEIYRIHRDEACLAGVARR